MRKIYIAFLMVSASLWSRIDTAKGTQLPAPNERVWASSESSTSDWPATSVTSSTQAIDGNVQTASNLNILVDLAGLLGFTETVSFSAVPMDLPFYVKYGAQIAG